MLSLKTASLGFACPSSGGFFWARSFVGFPSAFLGGERAQQNRVAVLFARFDSIYKRLPGCDVWDIERDARRYSGNLPVIAHPPCRAWAGLRHMAKPRPDEKELALFAVEQVRRCGGVLEHPARSTLWDVAELPAPGCRDKFGGFTFPVCQSDFGHRAKKPTKLYFCGVEPQVLPKMPLRLGEAPCIIGASGRRLDGTRSNRRLEVSKAEREATPVEFAAWLFEAVLLCRKNPNFYSGIRVLG